MKLFASIILLSYVTAIIKASGQGRRHPLDKGVRFGHQNPIRVAPTLPPARRPTTTSVNDERLDIGNFDTYTTRRSYQKQEIPRCPDVYETNGKIVSFRLDKRTQKCFALGSTEPCGGPNRNMIFHSVRDDAIYGECDCIQTRDNRPLIYHPQTDTCYFAYQQAYCSDTEWLVYDRSPGQQAVPRCEPNLCRSYGSGVLKWDWKLNADVYKNKTNAIIPLYDKMQCVPLGSVCRPDGTFAEPWTQDAAADQRNEETKILYYRLGDYVALCNRIRIFNDDKSEDLVMKCRPGSKLFVTGKC